MSLNVGDKLGPYEILSPLGADGMGEVNRASAPGRILLDRRDRHAQASSRHAQAPTSDL